MKISKQELLKCSSGEMFGIGNPQLPMPPMLMFDSICDISNDGGINDITSQEYSFHPSYHQLHSSFFHQLFLAH